MSRVRNRVAYPVALAPERLQSTLPHVRRELFLSAETQRKILYKPPEISVQAFQRLGHRLAIIELHDDMRTEDAFLLSARKAGDHTNFACFVKKVGLVGEFQIPR